MQTRMYNEGLTESSKFKSSPNSKNQSIKKASNKVEDFMKVKAIRD
jgi:hypothetical protein